MGTPGVGSTEVSSLEAHPSTGVDDSEPSPGVVPWRTLETWSASAFLLAGSLLIASVIVPVGLSAVTDWAWASGLLLVGLAVVAVAIGLLGLYPTVDERARRVAVAGALFAGIAGIAALGLIAGIGIALVVEVGFGTSVPRPIESFVVVALSMAGGFSLGYLLFGLATVKSDAPSRRAGRLLVVGGLLLLAPVLVELLGVVSGVSPPPWVLFPILGAVAIDTLAVGYTLSPGGAQEG